MQSILRRSRTAAVAATLVLGLGAALVAKPAAAQVVFSVGPAYEQPAQPYGWRHDDGRWGHRRGDHRPPVITAVTPSDGDRVSDRGRTRIAARFHDAGGSGIHSVSLRIDGYDVSHRIRVDDGEVRYRDDLAPGRHSAELVVRDRAGNATRHAWSFRVVDWDRYGGRNDDGGRYAWR